MFTKMFAAAALLALTVSSAQGSTILNAVVFDANDYNLNFGESPNVGEDFETLGSNLGEGEVGADFATAVGTFNTLGGVGSGGTVTKLSGNTGSMLALRDANVFGRTNNAPLDGHWFLDTNDTFGMQWDVNISDQAFNQVSFVIQDFSDTGAFVRITAGGEELELRTGKKLSDGAAKVIVIDFGQEMTDATIILGNYTTIGGEVFKNNDGFSIDGLQVRMSAVPLPMPILMLGTAIAGLGVIRRRKARTA
ncbi:MAG: VPLPA-CTERM sorting domain-containing protein [Roseobacter sp.]